MWRDNIVRAGWGSLGGWRGPLPQDLRLTKSTGAWRIGGVWASPAEAAVRQRQNRRSARTRQALERPDGDQPSGARSSWKGGAALGRLGSRPAMPLGVQWALHVLGMCPKLHPMNRRQRRAVKGDACELTTEMGLEGSFYMSMALLAAQGLISV
ncbi:uncharacterized protein PITG_00811 [Phytophthora infestans T30-4]|uniref:Uncharacterized protein n=1 Tax=Phytophthora infestans (strain T30-4) TaxID=403677 RepID=D0MRR6_PHYIT|nr:uncharacterized protein PITG_00811 [Phytophthora infestans T30-4]EEY58185.1 hypothetical protein PITG_00811 [Phytophthora infestans T30-4]|eukprot:XP_002909371.1 hypothetical protein PITG_00811 [Phytophthora infestans T30-4]